MSAPEVLDVRPVKLRRVAVGSAVAVVAVFVVLAALLNGEAGVSRDAGLTQRGWTLVDSAAMVGLGLVAAATLLLLARPHVVADVREVRIQGLLGQKVVPWGVVRGVRFDDDTPWAQLELHDDEVLSLLAVQANDGAHAFDAVDRLRALHAASRADTAP